MPLAKQTNRLHLRPRVRNAIKRRQGLEQINERLEEEEEKDGNFTTNTKQTKPPIGCYSVLRGEWTTKRYQEINS